MVDKRTAHKTPYRICDLPAARVEISQFVIFLSMSLAIFEDGIGFPHVTVVILSIDNIYLSRTCTYKEELR